MIALTTPDASRHVGANPAEAISSEHVREVVAVCLKLGCIAFGGPAAHIAMMRDEMVRRRQWVTDQHFLDLLGAANLIPGPSSTELAIFLSYTRAGLPGLVAGGLCFILPAMLLVMGCAWAYVQYGATPQANWLLYGVKPVIIGIVAQALWGLARTAIKGWVLGLAGVAVLALYLLGVNPLLLLLSGGLAVVFVEYGSRLRGRGIVAVFLPLGGLSLAAATGAVPFSMARLFLTFLKIGAVLYGSGYVLLAFLRDDFVERLGWLSNQQLLDAVAVGQFTPGPVFTTATFIGYLLGGVPGGLLATLAIFLPSFFFVGAVYPLVPRLRRSPWTRGFLDGVNAAALGLMAAVTWLLARAAIVDPLTAALALAALLVLLRFRLNSAWLVLAGAAIGLAVHALA